MTYAANVGRATGFSRTGLVGQHTLVTYVFRCLIQSASPLTLTTNVFADATPDNPQPMTLDLQNGLILCLAPTATPTALPAATATPAPVLPAAGEGTQSQPGASLWPLALAAFGAVAIGAALALRRRRG